MRLDQLWDPAPCPCDRPHGHFYSDAACDAARRREDIVRQAAIDSSRERDRWIA
jgi:hypothetical protein